MFSLSGVGVGDVLWYTKIYSNKHPYRLTDGEGTQSCSSDRLKRQAKERVGGGGGGVKIYIETSIQAAVYR